MQFFNIKKLLGDTKKIVVIVSCMLLLVGNIAIFSYIGTGLLMPTFLTVTLSNIVTALITFAIYKPINKIIEEEVQEKLAEESNAQLKLMEELNELKLQKQHLEKAAEEREDKIRSLESELDTARQYKSISSDANAVLKLETMEYEKEGYVVKEEFVRGSDIGREIEKDSPWKLQFNDKGEQKILYIKKFHEKATIGIDLAKIRFCRHDGFIYLEGVRVVNLHPEMTLRIDGEDMERCMILNVEDDEPTGINHAAKYEWYKNEYTRRQRDMLLYEFQQEVRNLCTTYSLVIRENLASKFPTIRFVDDKIENAIDIANEPVFQLNATTDNNLLEVSNSIVLIANTITGGRQALNKR